MAIAKVILNGETQMDVTQKTVTAGSMLSGTTALKNDGTDITGNIASKTSSDLTASGATVTAPAGYYASNASKSVASGSAKTPATTITANPSISVNSSGLITATVSKTQSVTPTVSAGYVASGTAGTITVSGSGTSQLTTQAAQTIHPSTTDQTIASGRYLTGAQTIKAVTTTNLTAANIVQGVTVKVGDSTDDDCVASVTGTAETGGNDFIITLTKNASTGIWEPDCTYAEMYAAYTGGKTVVVTADDHTPCEISIIDDPAFRCDYYVMESNYDTATGTDSILSRHFNWTSSGITESMGDPAYYTYNATAVPADVASGKVFYNADGYQVGTASGGATNFVQGTFTTSATTGKQTIYIPYSGNGYPIVAYIEPANGLRTIYDSGQKNAVGGWLASKTDKSTAPTYRSDYASMVTISGSTSAGSTSTSFNVQSTYTARNGADSLNTLTSIAFMSATQLSVFIRDSNIGLLPSTVYSYYIVYSE